MDTIELDRDLAEVQKKGFVESFALFCANTFSSFSYPDENLAAARAHAYFLRLFIEERVTGSTTIEEIPESLYETFREVGRQSIQDTLSSVNPSGMECCRAFVRNWCERHSVKTRA